MQSTRTRQEPGPVYPVAGIGQHSHQTNCRRVGTAARLGSAVRLHRPSAILITRWGGLVQHAAYAGNAVEPANMDEP